MAVKLRLMRMGKKKHPTYRVVAADSRSPRDGRFIELIGRYDPHPHPSVVEIDNERALHWLEVGAQPTDAVRKLLEISGAWGQFRVKRGDVHVVGDVAPPEERERKSKKARAREAEEAAAAAEAAEAAADEVADSVEEPVDVAPEPVPQPEAAPEPQATAAPEPAAEAVSEAPAQADAAQAMVEEPIPTDATEEEEAT